MGKGLKDLIKLVIVIVVLCAFVYLYPEENPEIKKQMYFGVVGGGVAANPKLREAYRMAFERMGVRVTVPPFSVCGDNGAMIAIAALRSYYAGLFADLSLDATPNAKLGTWTCDLAPTIS